MTERTEDSIRSNTYSLPRTEFPSLLASRQSGRPPRRAPAALGQSPRSSLLFALSTMVLASCSSGSTAGGTGGSSGMGGNAGTLAYKPCPEGARVGGFSVALVEAADAVSAFTNLSGEVKNAVNPALLRQDITRDGACALTDRVVYTCTPACSGATAVCGANNICMAEAVRMDVGTVTLTGLGAALTLSVLGENVYSKSLTSTYPPFAPGTSVSLSTSGGKYPPFMLSGRGIEPLEFSGAGVTIGRNKPLTVTWTAPVQAGSARIFVRMEIAHHGGGSARLECDVPDTGSTTIASTLINQLMDKGVAGFPTLSLTRQTVDSVNIAPGCVDLLVASPVERPLAVEGVRSCNCTMPPAGGTVDDPCDPDPKTAIPCPAGQTCQPLGSPKALTCSP